ncbi:MAG: hypothetical protein NT178_01865 [Proteobacteria bacterium]|nr:hypothetical protein [Pseudomonadota bacterium]
MSAQINQGMGPCCAPSTDRPRMLTFPDGGKVGVTGLDRIFNDAYREGKRPDKIVAKELVNRLSENNYIPSGAWSKYAAVVFKEYQKYFEEMEHKKSETKNINEEK